MKKRYFLERARMELTDMAKTFLEKYKIFTVTINGSGVHGCRIFPNVFTRTEELGVFVSALKLMGSQGNF
jgi:hypothetical protein